MTPDLVYNGAPPQNKMAGFAISVETLIYHDNGTLFFDDHMRWHNVNETVREWFVASCKTTAFWLIKLPEATSKAHTLKYRTRVYKANDFDGRPLTDTTLLEFEHLTYQDMVRFQRWALEELHDLIDLFERQHAAGTEHVRPRSKVKTVLKVLWQMVRNKARGQ